MNKYNKRMRVLSPQLLCLFSTVFSFGFLTPAYALDTSAEEAMCKEIGFKPKTEKYANCVIELYERKSRASFGTPPQGRPTSIETAQQGDGTQDDQTCQRYGLRPGQPEYGNCRMQIDLAKQQVAREQARYQQEMAAYEQQVAELKRQKDKERAMRQLELGLRMMGGQPPLEAINSLGTGAPISKPRPPITHHSIRLPNGRTMNCDTFGGHTNCN